MQHPAPNQENTQRQRLLQLAQIRFAGGVLVGALLLGMLQVALTWNWRLVQPGALAPEAAKQVSAVLVRTNLLEAAPWQLRQVPQIGPSTLTRLEHYRPLFAQASNWTALQGLGRLSPSQLRNLRRFFFLPNSAPGPPASALQPAHDNKPWPYPTRLSIQLHSPELLAQASGWYPPDMALFLRIRARKPFAEKQYLYRRAQSLRIPERLMLPLHRVARPGLPRLDINLATRSDWRQIPGIGAKLSQRIVTHRRQQGGLLYPQRLRQVKGIGPKLQERIRQLLAAPFPTSGVFFRPAEGDSQLAGGGNNSPGP